MGSATARRTTSASLATTGWVVSALPRSFRYHCSLVQLFKNTKVRWGLQVTSSGVALGRLVFSTTSVRVPRGVVNRKGGGC